MCGAAWEGFGVEMSHEAVGDYGRGARDGRNSDGNDRKGVKRWWRGEEKPRGSGLMEGVCVRDCRKLS